MTFGFNKASEDLLAAIVKVEELRFACICSVTYIYIINYFNDTLYIRFDNKRINEVIESTLRVCKVTRHYTVSSFF